MKTALIFSTALLAMACGKDEKNACEQLQEEMCACTDVTCEEASDDTGEASEGGEEAEPTDEELEQCEAALENFSCDDLGAGLGGGNADEGVDTGIF